MIGKTIYHNGQRYSVTQWKAVDGTIAVDPNDQEVVDLLRHVLVANMPLLYYYNSNVFAIIHPNLPTPQTTT
ncbi:MAG TPA: hypothetical protein PKD64_18665 [Pirellulaceae bacterium]|nr:hypothetical protein [Pirellulaceae bacterium]HMO94214.1 hypothetical protein [Pirellulaceae bacterium]